MTEKEIKDFCSAFNDLLIENAEKKNITPEGSNADLVVLADEALTAICRNKKLELRKFILQMPHKDEETGEISEIEAAFLVTNKSGLSVQFELSDMAETSRFSTCLVDEKTLKEISKNIFPGNNIDSPITKEFVENLYKKAASE